MNANKQAVNALTSRAFSLADRNRLAADVAAKLSLHPVINRLFSLLAGKERLGLISDISAGFGAFIDESRGVVRGTVTTVAALSETEREDLAKAFSKKLGKQVVLNQALDKTILGGLVVNVQGQTFDGSLKTSIRRIKESLL